MTASKSSSSPLVVDVDHTSMTMIERVRRRDQEAWNVLARAYTPLVLAWCRRGQIPTTDLRDVAQEVFLDVSRRIVEFRRDRPGDSFRAWLRSITRFKVADYWRKRDPAAPLDWEPCFPEKDDPEVVVSEMIALVRRVVAAVRKYVEPRTWQAFWRTQIDERTSTDVADELGTSPAAVRKARQRVRERLERELNELVGDDANAMQWLRRRSAANSDEEAGPR